MSSVTSRARPENKIYPFIGLGNANPRRNACVLKLKAEVPCAVALSIRLDFICSTAVPKIPITERPIAWSQFHVSMS